MRNSPLATQDMSGSLIQALAVGIPRSRYCDKESDAQIQGGGMRSVQVLVLKCLACVLVVFVACSSPAFAAWGGTGSSLPESPLVVPGGQVLLEGEGVREAEEARHESPEAVVAREESQTKYEGLGGEAAAGLAREMFPGVIEEPAGGPPKLPAGQRITGFADGNTARVELGGGQSGLVDSLAPIAIQGSSGGWEPVDLDVNEAGGAFAPVNPLVAVRIPKRLGEGVQATTGGLSLTPVDAQGSALEGSEGVAEGTSVFYANTATDSDTVVKASTFGFQVDTLLRSEDSPEQFSFRVGLPKGASLSESADGSSAQVLDEGSVIARIPVPLAWDAEGTMVPVSMGVSGDTLTLTVDRSPGEFRYPIMADPDFYVGSDTTVSKKTWLFKGSNGKFSLGENSAHNELWIDHSGEGANGESAELYYKTNGESTIYKLNTVTEVEPTEVAGGLIWHTPNARAYLEYEPGGSEANTVIAVGEEPIHGVESGKIHTELCAPGGCTPHFGATHNLVRMGEVFTGGTTHEPPPSIGLSAATVGIAQSNQLHTTVSLNKGSPELEYTLEGKKTKTVNVANFGGWLGPNSGALEFTARDLGVGVSEAKLEFEGLGGGWSTLSSVNYLSNESACHGVQCSSEEHEVVTYHQLATLGSGEDKIRFAARDAVEHTWSSEHGEGEYVVKIDSSPPHSLSLTGLVTKGEELELGEVEGHVKAEATDGESFGGHEYPSSGIKSLELYADGKQIGKPEGYCGRGPCTASAEWAINGAELGVGQHVLTVKATDNAGNIETKSYTLDVYHASPVAMGPGSVNPESGDFALEASDVGVSGGTGVLAVSQHYDSRNLREGEEGSLGPQWSVSLGGLASLEVLPDGSVMVVGPEGLTHFSVKKEGGFEAPPGDSNLTLEYVSGSKEYVLKDAKKGTTTGFTLPVGASMWMPTISKGPIATDTTTDSYQTGEAVNEYPVPSGSHPNGITSGPDGNLWFTDWGSSKIGKITPAGVPTEYRLPELSDPGRIVTGPEGNMWFTDGNTSKIGKITPAGQITEYSMPGSAPGSIVYGAEGELWFTTPNKIGAIKVSGSTPEIKEFTLPAETQPSGITEGPEGNMWFTNAYCAGRSSAKCKIDAISPAGTVVHEYPLSSEADTPEAITPGPEKENALWFTNTNESKIGKIALATGEISEYSLPGGSKPRGITAGPDGNLWFADSGTSKIGKITPSGTVTEYSLPSGSEPSQIVTGPGSELWFTDEGTNKIGRISTSGVIVEPKLELAPHPSLECTSSQLEKREIVARGCRALEFTYAKTTTAKGPNKSEWGEYRGRLVKVTLVAYNRVTKAMVGTPVAAYEYDQLGWLRAEWNPELPELKTLYGYDGEGHVTALTPPGQESWAITYGTTLGDASTGRLLKLTRAPASSTLWGGEALVNSGAPVLSGTPAVGVRMSVSNGSWSGGPVAYSYQWEDCNTEGLSCTPILGATNANYTPASGDVGHTLVAQVTATNGGGTVVAVSVASAVVVAQAGFDTQTVDSGHSLNAVSCIPSTTDCVLSDSAGKALYATNVSTSSAGSWTSWSAGSSGSSEAVDCPSSSLCLLSDNIEEAGEHSDQVYYATSLGGSFTRVRYAAHWVNALSCPTSSLCVAGMAEYGYFLYSTSPLSSWTSQKQGEGNMKGVFCLSSSFCVLADSKGSVHVATSTSQIESSSWKETDVDGSTALNGVACTATTSCVAVDGSGNALKLTIESSGAATAVKHDIDGSTSLTGVTCIGSSACVAVDSAGNIFVSKNSGESWTKQYSLGDDLTSVSCASSTLCVAGDTTGKETAFNLTGEAPEGEALAPQPGTTIEYNMPLQGAEAPQQMGLNEETHKEEPAKWGQEDDPVYATAIYPPEEPQGWPAVGHKRATTYYMDNQAHTVNVASPFGGVTTTEYNEDNQVKRTLSADNRAKALEEKEEAKSIEVAELLSTRDFYSEGRLEETLGPQHEVRLAVGKGGKTNEEVLARNRVKYYYDEGAKEAEEKTGETYNLVTKMVDAAETASKEVFDERTSLTSYSGQSDLGWTLRKPTSTTTDPAGLNLKTTTIYEPSTGNVTQTKGPEGTTAYSQLAFTSAFGSKGKENGQFEFPTLSVLTSTGSIWVVDSSENRVQEFNAKGEYEAQFGSAGAGGGQFKFPFGIAVEPSNGDIVVADREQGRIEVFSSTGSFIRTFGWGVSNGEAKLQTCTTACRAGLRGGGTGQLETPDGVAVDSSGNIWTIDEARNRFEEYSETGEFIKQFGVKGSEPGQINQPIGIAYDKGNLYITEAKNERVQEFSTSGSYLAKFGSEGSAPGQFKTPYAIAVAPGSGDLYVTDRDNNRVEKFTPAGVFVSSFGTKGKGTGKFEAPTGVVSGEGEIAYVSDHNNQRVQKWTPAATNAHETKTSYYTAKEEAEVPGCRNHPEWAGLPCQTEPAAQPGDQPELPVKKIEYNMWEQPEIVTETFGSQARTRKTTFDGAGRPLTSEVTASIDVEVPKVTNKYSTTNGFLETQSAMVGESTKTITILRNTWGQLESYTDAEGNTAKYTHDAYGRPKEMTDSSNEGKTKQNYTYSETTGAFTGLEDSAAKTFSATYGVGGEITSETYPNGMTAYYTHNSVGQTTTLEYKKKSNCGESCIWISDTIVPSIHGETMMQKSTLSEEPNYTYNNVGYLTQVQEILAGEGCTTRTYTDDEESNRTSLTTSKPNSEGKCTTENGTVETHTYDAANHLTDQGITYEPLGNTTYVPALDAGGSPITSAFYVDGQVYSQTQNEETTEYKRLDPEGRPSETITSGKTAATIISHYDAPGGAAAWTSEEAGKKTSRSIAGIAGELVAVQTNGGTPVLQLHDLQGDIVATASMSEAETHLLSKFNSTEFGVPTGKEAPPKYAWLGALGVANNAQTTGTITQDGVTYVPETGQALQTEGITLPAPENAATPFDRPIEAWVGSQAGEGAARELAKAAQEQEEREAANTPPGVIPYTGPAGGGIVCDEEIEGCGPDPEHGENSAYCSVWVSWDHYFNNRLGITGHAFCVRPEIFEIQIALLEKLPDGHFATYEPKSLYKKIFHNGEENTWMEFPHTWVCEEKHLYQAWVFGRYWYGKGKTVWYATAEDGHLEECSVSSEDPTGGPAFKP